MRRFPSITESTIKKDRNVNRAQLANRKILNGAREKNNMYLMASMA